MTLSNELNTYSNRFYKEHLDALSHEGRSAFLTQYPDLTNGNSSSTRVHKACRPAGASALVAEEIHGMKPTHYWNWGVVLGVLVCGFIIYWGYPEMLALPKHDGKKSENKAVTHSPRHEDTSAKTWERKGYTDYAPWGIPDADYLIRRDPYYIFGFPKSGRTAVWVCYRVVAGTQTEPSQTYSRDPLLQAPQLNHTDHRDGYVFANLISPRHIRGLNQYEKAISYFSVKALMNQDLHQRTWTRINNQVLRQDNTWVTVGAVTDAHIDQAKDPIPTAFFIIFARGENRSVPTAWSAYLIPNQTQSGHMKPEQFLTTIDEVESQTGLDFFSDLEDQTFEALMPPAWTR